MLVSFIPLVLLREEFAFVCKHTAKLSVGQGRLYLSTLRPFGIFAKYAFRYSNFHRKCGQLGQIQATNSAHIIPNYTFTSYDSNFAFSRFSFSAPATINVGHKLSGLPFGAGVVKIRGNILVIMIVHPPRHLAWTPHTL